MYSLGDCPKTTGFLSIISSSSLLGVKTGHTADPSRAQGGEGRRTKELAKAPDHVGEAKGVDGIAIRGKLVTDRPDVLGLLHSKCICELRIRCRSMHMSA